MLCEKIKICIIGHPSFILYLYMSKYVEYLHMHDRSSKTQRFVNRNAIITVRSGQKSCMYDTPYVRLWSSRDCRVAVACGAPF